MMRRATPDSPRETRRAGLTIAATIPSTFAVAAAWSCLALELRLRHLDADDDREALADVVAGHALVVILDELVVGGVLVDRARERRAEAAEVRAALDGVDVVAVAVLVLRVGVGVLHADLALDPILRAAEEDDRWMHGRLVLVEIADELGDAALEKEALAAPAVDVGDVIATRGSEKASSRSGWPEFPLEAWQEKIVLSGWKVTRVPVCVEVPISWSPVTGTPRS